MSLPGDTARTGTWFSRDERTDEARLDDGRQAREVASGMLVKYLNPVWLINASTCRPLSAFRTSPTCLNTTRHLLYVMLFPTVNGALNQGLGCGVNAFCFSSAEMSKSAVKRCSTFPPPAFGNCVTVFSLKCHMLRGLLPKYLFAAREQNRTELNWSWRTGVLSTCFSTVEVFTAHELTEHRASQFRCSQSNRARRARDQWSSCGIRLMPVVHQVVGFGRGDGRHSGRHRRSVVYLSTD